MYKYRNRSDRDLTIAGVGVVIAGAEFETELLIENPSFELLEVDGKKPEVASPDTPPTPNQPQEPQTPAPEAQAAAPEVGDNGGIVE